jgi:hypothetical protein
MRSRTIALSFVFCFFLSLSAPIIAAPRGLHREGPIDKIVRIIKKAIGVITNGDALIPPTP